MRLGTFLAQTGMEVWLMSAQDATRGSGRSEERRSLVGPEDMVQMTLE